MYYDLREFTQDVITTRDREYERIKFFCVRCL